MKRVHMKSTSTTEVQSEHMATIIGMRRDVDTLEKNMRGWSLTRGGNKRGERGIMVEMQHMIHVHHIHVLDLVMFQRVTAVIAKLGTLEDIMPQW
jgi:hypothetical protein